MLCPYAQSHYAECCFFHDYAYVILLKVIMLSVIILSVIMLNEIQIK
jgi:hypothetical protein